ncbi:MAG: hypothetical protein J5600_05405 [Desulfovibrio sp.]|nr:hypothetical protein [Desulfovibrio sp.]MBR4746961.1 hypothetical protein [Desulfovibrio sp.]MBR5050690.1 hypothetical protein [Desulfovibrio sp.]
MAMLKRALLAAVLPLACNAGLAQAADDDAVFWLGTSGSIADHKGPLEACYLTFHGNAMVMHWVEEGKTNEITIYKITKKEGDKIYATQVGWHEIDENAPDGLKRMEYLPGPICGTFSGDRLVLEAADRPALKEWITLKRVKLKMTGE